MRIPARCRPWASGTCSPISPGGGGLKKLYVDGTRWARAPGTDANSNAGELHLYRGGESATRQRTANVDAGQRWWAPVKGAIADVRMSSIDRYLAEFVPQPHLTADDSTLALWHLDDEAGYSELGIAALWNPQLHLPKGPMAKEGARTSSGI